MKLVVINKLSESRIADLTSAVPGVTVEAYATPQEALPHVSDADALVLWGFQNVQPLLEAAPRVRWVHSLSDGVEKLVTKDMLARDIVLTNSHGIHDVIVAEHTLALILAWTRNIPMAVRHQVAHQWKRPSVHALAGQTALIVGYGNIGRAIAKRLHAFGVKIIAIQKNPKADSYVDAVFPTEDTAKILPQSDIIIAALPATPSTEKFFDETAFSLMKKTALFVNISRATVVDEDALVKNLKEERLAGAATDVFSKEPLPTDHPFWDMENLIMTPHIGAMVPDFMDKLLRLVKTNLIAFTTGKEMRNVIDKEKGY